MGGTAEPGGFGAQSQHFPFVLRIVEHAHFGMDRRVEYEVRAILLQPQKVLFLLGKNGIQIDTGHTKSRLQKTSGKTQHAGIQDIVNGDLRIPDQAQGMLQGFRSRRFIPNGSLKMICFCSIRLSGICPGSSCSSDSSGSSGSTGSLLQIVPESAAEL